MRKLLAFGLVLMLSSSAAAQVAYSNITNFSGFVHGSSGAGVVGTNTITQLFADDILPVTGAGNEVSAFTFSIGNVNGVAVTFRPRIRFFDDDAGGGLPGTVLAGFDLNPITLAGGTIQTFTVTILGSGFIMPTGLFWAGVAFDNADGTTGATLAQLNNIRQGIFNPPTVGSSLDLFFRSTAPGDLGPTPAGGLFFFGGSPVANFGWEFFVTPEPSATLLAAGIGFVGLAAIRRYRRRTVAAA